VLLADGPRVSVAEVEGLLSGRPGRPGVALPADVEGVSVSPGHARRPPIEAPAGAAVWPVRPYARADSHPGAVLVEALAQAGGNQSRAAQALGLTLRQFAYRWRKLGLDDAGREGRPAPR